MTTVTCIFFIILLILGVILAVYALIIGIRNDPVYNFRLTIVDLISNRVHERLSLYKNDDQYLLDKRNFDVFYERLNLLNNKHSYERMLYSLKPLKLEYWFTEDEIKLLTTPQEKLEK